ncbi:MAG: hypothetical protein JWR32_113 [Mycobacterium sp.]|jgi:hypothetical protein|nr:hypothetical protein [Mycobacterium sp.]
MPDQESGLEAVARSDRLLDALAAGARVSQSDPVASMLAGWRDDVRRAPDTDVISLTEAATALTEGRRARPSHRFGVTVVGAVAAALLCLGGFGAVIYGAGPGDALYGLRTMLFGQSHLTRDDQVALAAQTQLTQAQQLIQQGQWQQAQDKLAAVSSTVQTVTNSQRKQDLVEQWNNLTVKVVQRDPNATLAPGAPPPTLPGMSSPLLPGPAVVPGTPTSPSPESVTSTTTSGSETTTTTSPSTVTSTTTSASTATPSTETTTSQAAAPPPTTATTTTATTATTAATTTAATTTAATTTPTGTTASTTTATPTVTSSPTPPTSTVTSAPRSEDTSTSAAAVGPNGPAPGPAPNSPATVTSSQQQGPAVANQQTSESASTPTATSAHGADHGLAPGPRGNGPGNGPGAPVTTVERGN